jgi:hypothetical protein
MAMTTLRSLCLPLGVCLGLGAWLAATPAMAQAGSAGTPKPPPITKSVPPPPALPGATSSPNLVIPADKTVGDMAPNEMLFDAISRGDIATARTAMSRGADLKARNVLGLTPIDMSVDLGRNDITFFLLSMRDAANGPPPGKTSGKAPTKAQAAAFKSAPPPRQAAVAAAPAPKSVNRQFVGGDPGTPAPQAGFLGFGATHP